MNAVPYWRLSGFYFFYFAFVGAISPFWGLYLQSLAFNAFQIGVLMSLLQVMRIFAPNIWGHVADRTGRRAAIVQLAAFGSVLAFAGVFFGTSFWWMFAVMAALSFFWSASLPLVEAMTLSHLGERIDGYGRIRLWGSIGFVVMVVGLGYALDRVSIAWLPWAILGVMLGIALFARVIPEAEIPAHGSDGMPIWTVVKRPEVAALLAACMLMAVTHGPYYTFYSIYLVDHGYDKSTVGWLWALGVLCEIGVFLVIPRVFARVTPRRLLLASFALAVLRFLMIAWGVESPWIVWGAQTLHAFTFGTFHAAAVALIHQHFRGRHQARGQALYTSLSYGVGGTLGGLISGVTWDGLGPDWTFTLAAASAALAWGVYAAWGRTKALPGGAKL
ncbi:MFS transporter [Betaproteobacteria bacterium SCN1]|jgi:PPP family 3-phenylpropionic acid transporter|nr:MFS transporter [Betaproteobacteria bacterium SCN1]MBN8761233.1 MFS transporter [Thiobacillus sp.]ODU88466.1 MAG: MFS transporter [Thiobacillus sp. SCN 65-179]OJW36450.1 MAG: MFS transporter [Thiobacillus sp. 65-69]